MLTYSIEYTYTHSYATPTQHLHTHAHLSHAYTITCTHRASFGESVGKGPPCQNLLPPPPPPLRICKFYASLVMPPKLFHTGGLKLPLLAALGLSNLTPEQMALLGPALSSQLGNSKLL